ncbi:dTDP-glucose 4,6-dehydratase [Planctomycetes bacterium CA13]|uniref:dTDP-glucose 4,6-dehydratase n=1 Tax=Novipirellula herctigrandis TaxID=2527986 RepID=A0A5C5YW68_9BACT|nr:dTDP-glucose 4,6-dehydratase [Planctomycetes bacterium CA13]
METLFITGATGFIGSHLVREAIRNQYHCRCLVREGSKTDCLPCDSVELIRGDLFRPETYAHALEHVDGVIHLAGQTHAIDKDALFRVNARACGFFADTLASRDHKPRIVSVSSLAAAGPVLRQKSIRDELDPPTPVSLYGKSKLAGEKEWLKRADQLPITILRPGIVYGPGDRNIAEMVRTIYRYRLHITVGFKTPPLSLVHVDDLVQVLLRAVHDGETLRNAKAQPKSNTDESQGIYFVCDDRQFPNYRQFGKQIAEALEVSVLVWPIWRWVGHIAGLSVGTVAQMRGKSSIINIDKVKEATVRSWASSSQKAREQLALQPRQTLIENLKKDARWYVDNGWA